MSIVQDRMGTAVVPPLAPATPAPAGPGAALKAARERAGLSLDDAAQALKLAPRQVKALEDEDFERLPGRTFARGFVRNYARLLNLDGDQLLAQLPDAARAPALASPALQSTGTTMGEVPASRVARPALTRWLIPLLLVTCVIGAGAYEWYRSRTAPGKHEEPSPPAATVQPARPSAGTSQTELPNPLSGAPADESVSIESRSPTPPASSTAGSGPSATVAPSSTAAAGAPAAAPALTEAQTAPSAAPDAAPLVLTYRASAWTQVRDARGQLLLNRVVAAGSEQPIRGTPPFEVTIGNARSVTLVYHGQEIDLARYTRQNIARLRLP